MFKTRPGTGSAARDPNRLLHHIAPTVKLAVPVVMTRAGLLLMLTVDTAMLGHYNTGELAGFAAASAVQIVMILIAVGLLQGTAILTAQSAGTGNLRACGTYLRASLLVALGVGIALGLLCLAGGWILGVLGQEPEVAAIGGRAFVMFSWSYPAFCIWLATAMFLEGLSRPVPGMVITLFGLGANVLLDWVFIFGRLGLPPMGAEGAAITTSIVRHLMLFALAGYLLAMRDREALGIFARSRAGLEVVGKLCRLGLPLAISRALESGAFSALTLIAGLIGPAALAGYQITYNLIGLVFMAAVGTATATMIRVGNAVGRRNAREASRAGWAGVLVVSSVTTAAMIVFFAMPEALASLYTDKPALRALVTTLIFIGGFTLILDGAQMVLQGALRGLADIWTTSAIQFSAWWVVCVPLSYGLSLSVGLGPEGLIWAILAGSIVAASTSALRFRVLTARGIAPR
jgi:MATE family multidrug resistance protein